MKYYEFQNFLNFNIYKFINIYNIILFYYIISIFNSMHTSELLFLNNHNNNMYLK